MTKGREKKPRKPKSFEDSLESQRPDLAAQWDYEANFPYTPADVSPGCNTEFHWIHREELGGCGGRWPAQVNNRVRPGRERCPCQTGGKVLLRGVNDLLSKRPNDVAPLWHPTRNGDLTPADFTEFSNEDAWFLGPCRHSWHARIADVSRGQGCAVCHGKQIEVGVNDLATRNPDVAATWDYERNADTPQEVTEKSHKKKHWLCPDYSHPWEATVASRAKSGCPVCAGRTVLPGFNDLATTEPEVAATWDYERNADTPQKVTAGSNKRRFWHCPTCSESWEATVANRCQTPACRHCGHVSSGEKRARPAPGEDLATKRPDLAAEWDQDENKKPASSYKLGSSYLAAWVCSVPECRHHWKAQVCSRTALDADAKYRGCPKCRNRLTAQRLATPKPGYSLWDVAPTRLREEWDPANPKPMSAYNPKAKAEVGWICSNPECRHHFTQPIFWRTASRMGCPECAKTWTSQVERDVLKNTNDTLGLALTPLKLNGGYFIERNGKPTKRKPVWDMGNEERRLLIDYDGFYHHSKDGALERDTRKSQAALEDGWRVLRIREAPLDPLPITHPQYEEITFAFDGNTPSSEDMRRLIAAIGIATRDTEEECAGEDL